MKRKAALATLILLSVPALAQERREPSADGTVPLTDKRDGPAATALPELGVSPHGTTVRPNSDASRKAEERVEQGR